ncbi:hypothetical protein [Microseira sp. BLCC-F43]|uniref:hypothetical protein n=1 Tax=Microseira sp. BLCC-F43 TaxID=3153602 RepID=UPI0035BA90D8
MAFERYVLPRYRSPKIPQMYVIRLMGGCDRDASNRLKIGQQWKMRTYLYRLRAGF